MNWFEIKFLKANSLRWPRSTKKTEIQIWRQFV